MKIGQPVATFYARPQHEITAPASLLSGKRDSTDEAGVRVSISADAIAALEQAKAAASSHAQAEEATPPDALPKSSKPIQAIATPVPEHDTEAVFKSLQTRWSRGKDLNNMAESLAASMHEVMDQRPDLSQKPFDFVLDNGWIRVVSDQLKADDRIWLEGQLNASTELLASVQQFHDHTVEAYALLRKGYGDPLSDAEYAQANTAVDKQFKYMSLLQDMAGRIRHEYRAQPEFSYRDQDGAPLRFEPVPGNAQGIVEFMDRIHSLQSGPLTVVSARGQADQVRFNDPFGVAGMIIAGYPPE